MNLERFKIIQKEIAAKVNLTDKYSIDEIDKVAGFDVSYFEDQAVCAGVVLSFPKLELIEKNYIISKVDFPYIPKFLAFREGPLILKVYKRLENKAQVILVEGHGLLHPDKGGLANYVGVILDNTMVIGVAKRLLAGKSVDGEVYIDDELRGYEIKTKDMGKPIYISPGHNISLDSSLKIVKECIKKPHKLPEPIHIAHKVAKKSRQELAYEEGL